MTKKPTDTKPDTKARANRSKTAAAAPAAMADRGESIGLMEPMLISESSRHRGALDARFWRKL
jgi:hypothetical protein